MSLVSNYLILEKFSTCKKFPYPVARFIFHKETSGETSNFQIVMPRANDSTIFELDMELKMNKILTK